MANKEQIMSYIDAMKEASSLITRENPDYLVVPMLGSIPFIDAMAIVDRDFDPTNVIYMPASSRINNISHIIKEWYGNFLEDVVNSPNHFPTILGIDEVVSGNSLVRCVKNIDVATQNYRKLLQQDLIKRISSHDDEECLKAIDDLDFLTDSKESVELTNIRNRFGDGSYRKDKSLVINDSKYLRESVKKSLSEKLVYRSIGIEDSKAKNNRGKQYSSLRSEGRILPVEVEMILTMDDPRLCPVSYEMAKGVNSSDYDIFTPRVKNDLNVTEEYVNFLSNLARYVGVNPSQVSITTVGNMERMLASNKYLEDSNNSH